MNQFLNTNWVSMQILRLLLNGLEVCDYFNRAWEKDFQKEFAPGSNITVKFPWNPVVIDGMSYQPQGIQRISTTISLDQWMQIPFEWDDYEAAVKLERSKEELQENYWEPAGAAMAQEADSRAAKFAYQNSSQLVGVLGTDATSVSTFYTARQRLAELACPPGKRGLIISSSQMNSFGSNITNVFHPVDEITRMWKKGAVGTLADFTIHESNSLYSHTAGTWAGSVTVTGAGQSGSSLVITGTNGDTINQGDKFSIALVNNVNPKTRRIVGPAKLKTFTATNSFTLTGGSDTITFLPAIYGPGSQYQNVDALPGNTAALTLWPGTASPNGKVGTVGLGLSRWGFGIVGAKLYQPKAVEESGQAQDPDTGIQVRKVKAWDASRSMQVNRLDSLIGFGSLYQDNAAVSWASA